MYKLYEEVVCGDARRSTYSDSGGASAKEEFGLGGGSSSKYKTILIRASDDVREDGLV